MMTPLSSSLSSSPQSSHPNGTPDASVIPPRHQRPTAAPPAPQHARCPPPTPTMPPCGCCSAAAPTTPRHTHRCRDHRPLSPPPPIHKHPDNAVTRCRRHPPCPTTMHTRRKHRDTQDRRVITRSCAPPSRGRRAADANAQRQRPTSTPTRKRRNGRRCEMDGSGNHNGRRRRTFYCLDLTLIKSSTLTCRHH